MIFTPSEIQALLSASYKKELYDVGKFVVDNKLSDITVKVYVHMYKLLQLYLDISTELFIMNGLQKTCKPYTKHTIYVMYIK
jgi:hypothetical protein